MLQAFKSLNTPLGRFEFRFLGIQFAYQTYDFILVLQPRILKRSA